MQCAYFVSDIHIEAPESLRAKTFLTFLRTLSSEREATHLFLLGDIFDLWVADHDYFVDRYRDIVEEIQVLKDQGVQVSYFEGNHDLHLRYFWRDQLGVDVYDGPAYFELAGKTVRLEHGDQMDPDDKGYLFLRWFLRTMPIRTLIRALPGKLIARIGDRASATSRDYTSRVKTIEPRGAIAKIREHARRAHAERPFDLIISGHVHVRDDHSVSTGAGETRSVNLGSWFDAPCYFKLAADSECFRELDDCEPAQVAASSREQLSVVG